MCRIFLVIIVNNSTCYILHQINIIFLLILCRRWCFSSCKHISAVKCNNHACSNTHNRIISRDHIFPQNAVFLAKPRNLPVSVELLCFHGTLLNSVLAGDIGDKYDIWHILVKFRLPYCMYTWFHHEIHDCHSGSDGRNTENIELSLSEILPDCICQLQLPVTNTAYLVGFRGHRKLIAILVGGKFAAVSRGIWQTDRRNLWSLIP